MLVWAVHNGGYDDDTWYWGALAVLALLVTAVVIDRGAARLRLTRVSAGALAAFALYVRLVVPVDHLGRNRRATRSRAATAPCSTCWCSP